MVQTDVPHAGPGDRRAEILRRAAAVFRAKGFHAAGMREIAAGLGMAPGALYYYFESKDELLYACQDIALGHLVQRARAILDDGRPPAAQLRSLIAAHLDLILDALGGSAVHVEFHALPPERLAGIVEKRDEYEALLRALVQRGIDAGAFRPVDVKLTVLALLGALNWSVVWWRPEGPWTARAITAGFADVFLAGLLQEGGTDGRAAAQAQEGTTP